MKMKNGGGGWSTLFADQYAVGNLIRIPIISKPNQSPYDTFVLDIGDHADVKTGSFMITDSQAVLGTIDSLSGTTAIGMLFSSPKVQTVARLERSNYDVTVVGVGGGNMVVEVPKEIETALGDKVLYPSFHNRVIGIIRDITLDDRDANKKLYITLPTNMLTLDHIYVEK
jgi:cell shape-determining protein MreC